MRKRLKVMVTGIFLVLMMLYIVGAGNTFAIDSEKEISEVGYDSVKTMEVNSKDSPVHEYSGKDINRVESAPINIDENLSKDPNDINNSMEKNEKMPDEENITDRSNTMDTYDGDKASNSGVYIEGEDKSKYDENDLEKSFPDAKKDFEGAKWNEASKPKENVQKALKNMKLLKKTEVTTPKMAPKKNVKDRYKDKESLNHPVSTFIPIFEYVGDKNGTFIKVPVTGEIVRFEKCFFDDGRPKNSKDYRCQLIYNYIPKGPVTPEDPKSDPDPEQPDGSKSYKGSFKIRKVDENNQPIKESATFSIKSDDEGKKYFEEFSTDENGETESISLEEGKYTIQEAIAPKGYIKNKSIIKLTVSLLEKENRLIYSFENPSNTIVSSEESSIEKPYIYSIMNKKQEYLSIKVRKIWKNSDKKDVKIGVFAYLKSGLKIVQSTTLSAKSDQTFIFEELPKYN